MHSFLIFFYISLRTYNLFYNKKKKWKQDYIKGSVIRNVV